MRRVGGGGGGGGGVMEEERFVWSIWRTQVSTLNWIKPGREGDRNEGGDKLDKGMKSPNCPQKIGEKIISGQSGLLYWDERAVGVAAVLFARGN